MSLNGAVRNAPDPRPAAFTSYHRTGPGDVHRSGGRHGATLYAKTPTGLSARTEANTPMPAIPDVIPQEYDPAVPLDQLTPHPANPNSGDVGLIGELLDANGFVGAVLAQKSSGILIDGEHRLLAARQHGMTTIPVMWADVDDDTRDRLLASINESNRRGRNDEQRLLDLLTPFTHTPLGLTGTAYSGDDLDDLMAKLNGPLHFGGNADGEHAETPEEEEERRDRIGGYRDRKEAGAMVEMILVFTTDEHAEAVECLAAIRARDGDLPAAQIMLAALRTAAPASEPAT